MGKFWMKIIVTFITLYVLAVFLPAVTATFSYTLFSTLLITFPGWFGDRMLLPHLSNAVAAALDGVYAFAVMWIADLLAPATVVTFTFLILAGVIIAGFEYMLHPSVFNRDEYLKGGDKAYGKR